jgi:hypothetical protein
MTTEPQLTYQNVIVERLEGKFFVSIHNRGGERCVSFDLYCDARAFAGGLYAAGGVTRVEDRIAIAAEGLEPPPRSPWDDQSYSLTSLYR